MNFENLCVGGKTCSLLVSGESINKTKIVCRRIRKPPTNVVCYLSPQLLDTSTRTQRKLPHAAVEILKRLFMNIEQVRWCSGVTRDECVFCLFLLVCLFRAFDEKSESCFVDFFSSSFLSKRVFGNIIVSLALLSLRLLRYVSLRA